MRPEKAFIVEDLLSRLQASPFLIITDYHGLKVDQFSDLRTRLAGWRCEVHGRQEHVPEPRRA